MDNSIPVVRYSVCGMKFVVFSFSSVYLVRHKQTKMRFAMKRLSKQRMIMKKQVQNIFQERDVLTVAENPFAVGLWCSFQTEVRDVANLFCHFIVVLSIL